MRRHTIVTLLVVAAVGTSVAVASAQTASTAAGTHFVVVERALTDTTVDTGPTGDSLGDLLAFRNPIFDATNTTVLGSDNGSCIRTRVASSYECSWTVNLSGGSLVVEGPFYDTSDSVLAVTGGTGRWSGARGQMTLHARNAAGSAYDFGFTLLP